MLGEEEKGTKKKMQPRAKTSDFGSSSGFMPKEYFVSIK